MFWLVYAIFQDLTPRLTPAISRTVSHQSHSVVNMKVTIWRAHAKLLYSRDEWAATKSVYQTLCRDVFCA